MRKFLRIVSIILVIALLPVMPANATENTTRTSLFFNALGVGINPVDHDTLEVWFDVVATGTMDKLGVSSIKVQRSSDASNWTTVHNYVKHYNSYFVCENTSAHDGCLTCTTVTNYYYRAKVTFYAEKDGGIGEYVLYSKVISLGTP